jgi:hypothetical protein
MNLIWLTFHCWTAFWITLLMNLWLNCIESESHVTTDGQPASLSWNKAPFWGLTTRSLLLFDSCGFVDVGRSLWREAGSVIYNSCLPSPAQSFSGPSPIGFVAIFYCLRFETSLFVASYDSQGHDGGIGPRLHTGYWIAFTNQLPFIIATQPE